MNYYIIKECLQLKINSNKIIKNEYYYYFLKIKMLIFPEKIKKEFLREKIKNGIFRDYFKFYRIRNPIIYILLF